MITSKFRTEDEQMAVHIHLRSEAIEEVKKRWEALQAEDGMESKKVLSHEEYKEGEFVLLYSTNIGIGVARKLTPFWEGPYVILRRTAAYNYGILIRGKERIVHARRLIKYEPYLLPDIQETKDTAPEQQEAEGQELDLEQAESAGITSEEAEELGLVRGKFYFIGGEDTKTLFLTRLIAGPVVVPIFQVQGASRKEVSEILHASLVG